MSKSSSKSCQSRAYAGNLNLQAKPQVAENVTLMKAIMGSPTKTVYENYCRICSSRKVTSKLAVIVTKCGVKTDTGKKLENYCGLLITPNGSRHICLCCKKKLDNIVSKVLELKTQWKKNEKVANQEPAVIRVKRMLSNENTRGSARARLDFPEQVSYNYI